MKNATVEVAVYFRIGCPHCKLYVKSLDGTVLVRRESYGVSGVMQCRRCEKKFGVPVIKMEQLADSMRELRVAGD